ncbi:transcriptional regulator LacI family [Ruminococcus sp. CAG:60]|nr:transcriptional regulator LacI family [Ruminococcus sp. CAG:60]
MTAVFVTNYEMTMGAVIGLNEMGVSLPEEISMVGFDNLPFARACRPALTIVSQPTEKIARETAQLMLARLEGKEDLQEPVVRKLQTDIFMGKSIRRQG